MYRLLRGVGFRMDPERAHRWALRLAQLRGAAWPGGPIDADPVDLFGLRFPNRVGLAAGYDKDATALRGLMRYGFGHLEVGTVTPRPQPGHPTPRIWRHPERRALINRMGFPSAGADEVVRRVDGARRAGILGVSIGPNADTDPASRIGDYESLIRSFEAHADYLAVNVSSPNTEGLRELQGEVGRVVTACRDARTTDTPIVVKLSPDLEDPAAIAHAAEAAGAQGLIVSNTTVTRPGFDEATAPGGLSGAPLGPLALQNLEKVRAATTIPLIASGGIMSVEDARRRIDGGASLVQIYTGLVYAGPRLVRRIAMELRA